MVETTIAPAAMIRALFDALESAGLGCTVVLAHPDRVERVYANEAMAAIYGVDVATMRTMAVFDALPDDQRERLSTMRWDVRSGSVVAPTTVETTILRATGEHVPVELALGYAMVGETRGVFVFARDISGKRAMEAALRASEDRFRTLAEASPDSITIKKAGRYVYANPVALGLMGYASVADIVDLDPMSLVPEDRRAEVLAYRERACRGEKVPPVVHRLFRDGQEVVVETRLASIDLGGEPALVTWGRDITERVRLQSELMRHNSLASVGILAAGVAHELNNPLGALAMQARKLRLAAEQRGLDDDLRASIAQIDEAAQRMSTIIADLLFMTRPSAQPQAHVDVAQILASTVALVRAGVERCPPIALDLAELPPVLGWPSKLGQVFLNVLRNAVQALEGRDGGIRVRAFAESGKLTITVADEGCGISPATRLRVMEPFYTTKPQGTGLGLWISQTLLAQQNGRLELASEPGVGTTVTIVLDA